LSLYAVVVEEVVVEEVEATHTTALVLYLDQFRIPLLCELDQ
jgi:hypothetical protein